MTDTDRLNAMEKYRINVEAPNFLLTLWTAYIRGNPIIHRSDYMRDAIDSVIEEMEGTNK